MEIQLPEDIDIPTNGTGLITGFPIANGKFI